MSIIDPDTLCQHYLNLIYRGAKISGSRNNNVSETYGEILYNSVSRLLAEVALSSEDVFLDLGSGLGKVVLQAFLQSRAKESWGIEIIPELHQQAVAAAQKVQHDLPDFYSGERKLGFMYGNFLEIPLPRASVILIGSPCFSPALLNRLGNIINDNHGIHSVLSLRPLCTLQRLRFKKAIRVECSWDSALCYIYRIM